MEQRTASPHAKPSGESRIITVSALAAVAVMVVGILWFVSPTEAERAATLQRQQEREWEEAAAYERRYIEECSNYPSSECSALSDFDDESLPCFVGQVKANRRSGIFHTPQSPWYAKTHADVICFKTAPMAERAGFRPAHGARE